MKKTIGNAVKRNKVKRKTCCFMSHLIQNIYSVNLIGYLLDSSLNYWLQFDSSDFNIIIFCPIIPRELF